MANEPRHIVLLVHGIRTHAAWTEMVAREIETALDAKVQPIRFGFFDTIRFFSPLLTRRAPIERIIREYRDLRTRYPQALISVIAHSFGTYAVTKALEEPDIVFYRIILCGTIVSDKFRVARYRAQIGADPILNDCGTHDIWPVIAQSITWGYGATGTFGFGTAGIRDRFSKFSHSAFFTKQFVRDYWLPYLRDGTVVGTDWETQRSTPPYWQSLLASFPLKWILLLAAFSLTAWLGYFFGRSDSPSLAVESPIYVGHWVGIANIHSRFPITNPTSSPLQFAIRSAALQTIDNKKRVPLQVEGIFDCDGTYQNQPNQIIIVPPRKTMYCSYSFLADFGPMNNLSMKINEHLNSRGGVPFSPTSGLFQGQLLKELTETARKILIWEAAQWLVQFNYLFNDTNHSKTIVFTISPRDVSALTGIIEHYGSGYGVLPNWRYATPDGSQALRQVPATEIVGTPK